ncbi:MAG: AbrB/MazE/SpoVT family DNA-binding domain-containing protein [Nitrososphaerota archaeon]|nr:AbrB/MazE/SpoVT family DNA-binding domain-containing protein [Nitrososphaerota archaeon]
MSEPIIETTKLSEKGQLVIPKEVRERMNLKCGCKFLLIATENEIILQRIDVLKERAKIKALIEKARMIAERLNLGN